MDPHDTEDESGEGENEPDDQIGGPGRTAREDIDGRIVDVLSWILDTETRAKIYVYLLANPWSTSEEVAKGTGLYPSTVREALAELHDEERVSREKRESEGAGNNPYEYRAIQPSELVAGTVDQIQHELNTIFTLDRLLERDDRSKTFDEDVDPVTITVEDTSVEIVEDDKELDTSREAEDEETDQQSDPHDEPSSEDETDVDSDSDDQ